MPAGEASVGSETGELIDREPLPAGRAAGRAWAMRDAEARLGAPPAALELGHRRVEVAHPETQHRRISLQVLAQQQAGPAACQPHLRDARAEGLDGEDHLGARDARVTARSRRRSGLALKEVELCREAQMRPGSHRYAA
jgi:hypothetical protein